MDKRYYMHVYTRRRIHPETYTPGDVDTEEAWIQEVTDDEKEDSTTKEEAFDEYVKERIFIEVKKDIDGSWKEV